MKNRASVLLKQITITLAAMVRSKTAAFKTKTRAFKTRLVIFSLIHNRKFLINSISHKLNALINHPGEIKPNSQTREDEEKAMEEEEEEGFENVEFQKTMSFDDGEGGGGSVIELVKKARLGGGEEEEEFRLEDEIDRVADLFIERFHRQMRLQKQLSFEDTP